MHPTSSNVIKQRETSRGSLQEPAYLVELLDDDIVMDNSNQNIGKRATVNSFICLQPKNKLLFPLARNARFPMSDDDIMHYCAIVDLAYTEGIQK
jgi:hypothetical protein